MKNGNRIDDGFLVDVWERIFTYLSMISVFYWIRKFKKNISYTFVDGWVLANLVFAILSSYYVFYSVKCIKVVFVMLCTYAIIRVFEVIVYQINVLLFDPYRARKNGGHYKIKSVTRMVIALLHNYVEIIFWYSSITIALCRLYGEGTVGSWEYYIVSSVLCIATFDKGAIEQLKGLEVEFLSRLAFFEIITGLIMTIISLARFIGILPEVETIDKN